MPTAVGASAREQCPFVGPGRVGGRMQGRTTACDEVGQRFPDQVLMAFLNDSPKR
ncbi:hypothetical protein GCM10009736_49700 [Actinomadura bangladeshensis]